MSASTLSFCAETISIGPICLMEHVCHPIGTAAAGRINSVIKMTQRGAARTVSNTLVRVRAFSTDTDSGAPRLRVVATPASRRRAASNPFAAAPQRDAGVATTSKRFRADDFDVE